MSERKTPIDRALDLFVYAPIGFVMNLEEVVPELVERGHQQVNMARMFGQFAVQTGAKEARKRLESIADRGRPPSGSPSRSRSRSAERPMAVVPDPVATAAAADGASADGAGSDGPVPTAAELPITDYDSLSASQVVPRLDGLSSDERDAVRRYEAAHRGRKTILSKLAQLA